MTICRADEVGFKVVVLGSVHIEGNNIRDTVCIVGGQNHRNRNREGERNGSRSQLQFRRLIIGVEPLNHQIVSHHGLLPEKLLVLILPGNLNDFGEVAV